MNPFRKYSIGFLLILALFLAVSCNKRVSDAVEDLPEVNLPGEGAAATLEIATWNIEMFPLRNDITVDKVAAIMLDWDIDLYAVQEIVDANRFATLVDSLNNGDPSAGYAYRLNPDAGTLRTGILFKSSLITVISEGTVFVGDNDFAGRPPYVLELRADQNGKSFDFTVIVLHLKAFGDLDSENRRRRSINKLEDYIDAALQIPARDRDFVVLGDWNDELDDPDPSNVFLPFLSAPQQYEFLTLPLSGQQGEFTFIDGFQSFLDHIMVTRSVIDQFPGSMARILRPDQTVAGYIPDVSDHRPVIVTLPAF